MDKIALLAALAGIGLGAFALLGPGPEAPDSLATKSALELVRGEVVQLRTALAAAEKALSSAAETRRVEGTVRREKLDGALAKQAERIAALESSAPDPDAPLVARELQIKAADGRMLLKLGASDAAAGLIEVFAKNGKRVAKLFARTDNDGELALYDENEDLRINLGGNDDGGYANFYGSTGSLAAYIGGDSEEPHGYLAIYGEGKKELVGLYGNAKGGVISVRNRETQKQVCMIGAAPKNGMGFIGLGMDEGKPGLALFCTKNGGQLKALNADGEAAAFIGVSANPAGNGLIYLSRTDGKRIMEVGATSAKGGYMSFNNADDERVLFLGASTGSSPQDGVLEVARKNGKLGVVLRAYSGGSSVRVYDASEKVKLNLR